jgi:acyl-CoA reductase-like NAD-dependent aldehyde dehydrogenase
LRYTREHGKVLSEANFEIGTGAGLAALIGSMAEAALAPEQVDPGSAFPRPHRGPFGVAALVLPFNWPLALTMTKLASALTAGNTAVVKVRPSCRSPSRGRSSGIRCRVSHYRRSAAPGKA